MNIIKLKRKLNKNEVNALINIIKSENENAIISFLSIPNLSLFLENIIISDKLDLFIVKQKNKLIGYAIIAKKNKYLKECFNKIILNFFFDLLLNLKIRALINSALSYLNLDYLLLNQNKKKIINSSANLNMLAMHQNYQSKGLGKKFLQNIIKKQKKFANYITCETANKNSEDFYKKKLGFKKVGNLIRFPSLMSILIKKI